MLCKNLLRSGLGTRIPSKRLHVAIFLIAVFSASFLVAFLAIYLTPSPYLHERAHSMPTNYWIVPETTPTAGPVIGPGLNATNVPLDTTVVIGQLRPFYVGDLQLSPEASIAYRVDEYHGPASRDTIFYFSEPLKPATTYNATLFFGDKSISWSFTTTAEPYHPRYEALPSGLGVFVAVTISAVVTLVVGLAVWKKECFGHQHDYPLKYCESCDDTTFDECGQTTIKNEEIARKIREKILAVKKATA